MVARSVLSALVTLVPLQRRVPAPADHPWVEQGGSSSPGILLLGVRPSVDISERVHSRPVETGPRPMAATPPDLVPLLRFLTAPAACSALRVAGLLHPAADPGVRRVSGRTSHSLRSGGGADLSRRRVSHPSEGCSSPTAAPCRHGRCLLAVTPRMSRFRGPPGWPGFEALLHRRVRYARPPLPVAVARASPGLGFPSRHFPSHLVPVSVEPSDTVRGRGRTEDPRSCRRLAFHVQGRSPGRSRRPTDLPENPIPEDLHLPAVALPRQEDGSAPDDPWPPGVPHPGRRSNRYDPFRTPVAR